MKQYHAKKLSLIFLKFFTKFIPQFKCNILKRKIPLNLYIIGEKVWNKTMA